MSNSVPSKTVAIYRLDYRVANPLLYHLLSLMMNPQIRRITNYGGSSSGKTYSIAQGILIMTEFDDCNTIVFRKVGASIGKTVWEDFKVASKQLRMFDRLTFKESIHRIVFPSGAKIDFQGLDDPEKIKGISNYKRVFKDELSEFDKEDDDQIRKRLRGMPGQQIIDAFNPISESHWIKTDYIDKDEWHDVSMDVTLFGRKIPSVLTKVKSIKMNSPKVIENKATGELEEVPPNAVLIQTTYLNNFWVIGSPDGTFGFYDRQCVADFERDKVNNPFYYTVYALGEWGIMQTGSEFFGSFDRGRHTSRVGYRSEYPIHVSVDNNVLPYISFSFWQVDTEGGTHIRQFDEVCATSPDNTVRRAARLVAAKVKYYGESKIYLHGDASTRAANNIDDEKRSWLDLLIEGLKQEGIEVVDVVGKKNPSVPISGEFINAIFDGEFTGIDIVVDENCKNSIEDYMSVQKDVNGAILKVRIKNKVTGQTYEPHGHLSDTFRYLICDVLAEMFAVYSQRRKRNLYANGAIDFFNPETKCDYKNHVVYAMPNVNGKFCMIYGSRCGDKWHITGIAFNATESTESMKEYLTTMADVTVIECAPAYYQFVRELRKEQRNVKVIKETSDIDRRIAATSDYVKRSVLFSGACINTDPEYAEFITNLLDYRKEGDTKEASTALSGFARYVMKTYK